MMANLRSNCALMLTCLLVGTLTTTLAAQGFGGGSGGAQAGGGLGGGLGGGQIGGIGGAPDDSRKSVVSPFDPLTQVIRTTVVPDSWDEMGGPGSLVAVEGWGVMVVSQTQDVHEQIADLLAVIRKTRPVKPASGGEGDEGGGGGEDIGGGIEAAKTNSPADEGVAVERSHNKVKHLSIGKALDTETSLNFQDSPLQEVAEFISETHKIPVYIDARALEEIGLGSDTPVTVNFTGISLRSGLKIMLNELGLTYMIKDEVLKLTTPELAESQLITRVYAVKDLAVPVGQQSRRASKAASGGGFQ